MILGIDPKIDYAFKKVFGRERTRPILESVTQAVLCGTEFSDISDLQILNPFNEKETPDDKLSVVDIRARDRRGRLINIEMQLLALKALTQRLLYYWAKSYSGQLKESEDYTELRPTLSICFLNGNLFPKLEDYHLRFQLISPQTGTVFCPDIELHLLELPKFKKSANEVVTPLDQWLFFLRDALTFDPYALPSCLTLPEIHQAVKELNMITQDTAELERYEARLKARRDQNAILHDARDEGVEFGRQEGLREGLIRTIRLGQAILRGTSQGSAELQSLSIAELQRLADELESQILASQRTSK